MVFQERLRTGKFESFIGAWLDQPSPRNLSDQWTGEGIGRLSYTHYPIAIFDSLFGRAEGFTRFSRGARAGQGDGVLAPWPLASSKPPRKGKNTIFRLFFEE